MAEEKRSYVIIRHDGLLIHTVPVTEDEAWWLRLHAYLSVENREARVRYLSEWGNVLDVREYMERLKQLQENRVVIALVADIHGIISMLGIYESPEGFKERASRLLGLKNLRPEARQVLEEFISKVAEFLKEPVRPRPLGPLPLRYLEMPRLHLTLGPDGRERTDPEAEWFAYTPEEQWPTYHDAHGISVFKDSLWLWRQRENAARGMTLAIVVRRDVSDGDVVEALAKDDAVPGVLSWNAEYFRDFIYKYEDSMRSAGYEDVVKKAKVVLATAMLLNAGRREEDVPLPSTGPHDPQG